MRIPSILFKILSRGLIRPLIGFTWTVSRGKWLGYSAYECELNDRSLFQTPGMTSPRERAFVKFVSARYLKGQGDVVELGPFLGALTCALLKGLNQSKRPLPHVRVYDKFRVDPYMQEALNALYKAGQVSRSYQIGESFRSEFERHILSLQPQPEVIEGSLSDGAKRRDKVELLVVDAMKDFPTCTAIVRSFYPDLIEGGFVLHQDFAHYWASWIHLLHHHLRDSFRFEFHVPMTSSVLYRCIRTPTEAEIVGFDEALCERCDFIDSAFAFSLTQVTDGMAADVQAAHVMAYIHCGRNEEAKRWFVSYTRNGSDVRREMLMVQEKLGAAK